MNQLSTRGMNDSKAVMIFRKETRRIIRTNRAEIHTAMLKSSLMSSTMLLQ